MQHRGGEIHLAGGAIRITTDDICFSPKFEYGLNEDFLKVFVLSYVKFLCDSPLESLSSKPVKVLMRFYKRLIEDNLKDVIKEYSGYADIIMHDEYSSGSDSSTRVFHEFMVKTPIFKEYHLWTRTGRPDLLRYVLSFLRFGKKLDYIDPELDATAFHGWLQVEERLRTLVFSDEDTASLRTIIGELVGPLEVDHLLPKFGSGMVSETYIRNVSDKLWSLSTDRKLEYTFFRDTPGRGADKGFGLVRPVEHRESSRSFARLKFVPKDISKSRSICMEPNAYMYFQQEVLRWVRQTMDRSPIRRFVDLSDQQRNRDAAVHGSMYLSSDTIDLSSASDSVHIDLVRKTFPKDWFFFLFGTRSRGVQTPDKRVVDVKKFAPMGSAVCFPTQCVLFTAICMYGYLAIMRGQTTGSFAVTAEEVRSLLRGLPHERSWKTPFGKAFEPPVVYGDDIICDSRCTDVIIAILERLGFEVNRAKSFTGSQSLRESCGVYAYEGQDVTPFLFRLPYFKRGKVDAKLLASIVDAINTARDHGYNAVATYWTSLLRDWASDDDRVGIPFTTDKDQFGVYTGNKHPVPLKRLRYNADWQRIEERVWAIGPRKVRSAEVTNLDEYRLDQWWRSRVSSTPDSPFGRGLLIRPQETRLVPIWARCE